MIVLSLFAGLAVFALTLGILTFATSLIADLAGLFRVLFVTQPYRALFRGLRWLVAAFAAAAVVAAIE